MDTGPPPGQEISGDLDIWHLLGAFAVILAEAAASRFLELNNAGELVVAGVRAFIQLMLLGFILHPIFAANNPGVVLGYIFGFMIIVSAYEASARPKFRYPGIFHCAAASLAISLLAMGCVLMLIIAPTPWYDAQYLIPLAGMLINNSLTGMALALNQMIDYLVSNKEHVEILLSFGATPWEAARPGFTKSIQAALIPQINGMNVVGLVSIPGMMTGQILGGASPLKAAKYQMVITFLISGCTFTAVSIAGILTIRAFFDERGRHDMESIKKQTAKKISQCLDLSMLWRKTKDPAPSPMTDSHAPLLSDGGKNDPLNLDLVLKPHKQCSAVNGAEVLNLEVEGHVAGKRRLQASLQLKQGEVCAIMGPSGIGKSTMLQWICDLRTCTRATMSLHGRGSHSMTPQAWRRDVMYVHQSKSPLPGTPRDLVHLVERLAVNKGRPSLNPVPCLQAFGLEEGFLDRPWNELSGGESQRMIISIAISTAPACLLLDEPTSALDDATKKLVEGKFQAADRCVLFVTHDEAQAARIATSVWRMSEA